MAQECVRQNKALPQLYPVVGTGETLPSGTVRDHRVERLAGVPRADQRAPQIGECPERLADRGRLVAELRLAGACGFAIRPADDPVVGFHHRVGEERLPLAGADRENREAPVIRELAQPVGEVAFPLPAQPRDPMWRDVAEEVLGNREAPDVLEAPRDGGCGERTARLSPRSDRGRGPPPRLAPAGGLGRGRGPAGRARRCRCPITADT